MQWTHKSWTITVTWCRWNVRITLVLTAIKVIRTSDSVYLDELKQLHTAIIMTIYNKAFINIRLCPGIATPLAPYGPLQPNVTSSIKPEVHNVSQRRQRRTKPRPQGIWVKHFVMIGPVVPEICSQTDRETQTYRLTTILHTPTGAE